MLCFFYVGAEYGEVVVKEESSTKRSRLLTTDLSQAHVPGGALALVDADGWMAPVRVKRELKSQLLLAGEGEGDTYEQPVVIEKVFVLRPSPSSLPPTPCKKSGASSCGSGTSSRRDMRRFRKNLVRGVNDAIFDSTEVVVREMERSSRIVIRMGDMVRVLPKESERELLVSEVVKVVFSKRA